MICPKCGKEIDDNDKFCQYCGNPVVKEENPVIEELPTVEENLVTEITPAAPKKRGRPKKNPPVVEVVPTVEETPIKEDVPTVEEVTIQKEDSVTEEIVQINDETVKIEEVSSEENNEVEEVPTTNENNLPSVENNDVTIVEEKTNDKEKEPCLAKKIIFGIIGYTGFTLSIIIYTCAIIVLLVDIFSTIAMAIDYTRFLDDYSLYYNEILASEYPYRIILGHINTILKIVIYSCIFPSILFNGLGNISKIKTKCFKKGIKLSIKSIFIPIISFTIFIFVGILLHFIFGIAYGSISLY